MLTFSELVKVIGVTLCISMVTPAFAESAPVYDVDGVQEEASAADQGQDLPPPPPPGQEAPASTFIPVQPTVASTGTPPPPPLTMDQRVQRVEQQVSNMQNSDAATQVDSLQNQVQALRGQIEQLNHQLEQMKNQQKAMYADLEGRLTQSATAETTAASETTQAKSANTANTPSTPEANDGVVADNTPPDDLPVETPTVAKAAEKAKPIVIKTSKKQTTSSESKGQPNVAEEQQIYQTAYNLIKAKRYNDAVTALQGMLKKYPSGQFASNAHYWLGELYGLMGKNDLALNEFKTVVETYPESPRVSDAQLKVGLLLASQLKWPEAKSALKRVINHYPGSASARMAAEQLKQIKIAGH